MNIVQHPLSLPSPSSYAFDSNLISKSSFGEDQIQDDDSSSVTTDIAFNNVTPTRLVHQSFPSDLVAPSIDPYLTTDPNANDESCTLLDSPSNEACSGYLDREFILGFSNLSLSSDKKSRLAVFILPANRTISVLNSSQGCLDSNIYPNHHLSNPSHIASKQEKGNPKLILDRKPLSSLDSRTHPTTLSKTWVIKSNRSSNIPDIQNNVGLNPSNTKGHVAKLSSNSPKVNLKMSSCDKENAISQFPPDNRSSITSLTPNVCHYLSKASPNIKAYFRVTKPFKSPNTFCDQLNAIPSPQSIIPTPILPSAPNSPAQPHLVLAPHYGKHSLLTEASHHKVTTCSPSKTQISPISVPNIKASCSGKDVFDLVPVPTTKDEHFAVPSAKTTVLSNSELGKVSSLASANAVQIKETISSEMLLSSDSKTMGRPCPLQVRLHQREKQIQYGYNTDGYQCYIAQIPKNGRSRDMPRTPNKNQACSKRSWDGQVRKWRRELHKWDPHSLDVETSYLEPEPICLSQDVHHLDTPIAI